MPAAQQNRAVHRAIVLQSPADLRAAEAEAPASAQKLEVEEGVDAAVAKLGPDAERHDARLADAPQTAQQSPEPEREEAPAPEAPRRGVRPARLLLVDDEASVREAYGEAQQAAGHQVVTAIHGEEAMSLFDSEAFDLVVTDLSMGGMSGLEVARRVKSLIVPRLS